MCFLQKYEICLLFSTPSIDFPPFSKVTYASHIQRDQFTFFPKTSKSIRPPVDGIAEVSKRQTKHKQCIGTNLDFMQERKIFVSKSVTFWAVRLLSNPKGMQTILHILLRKYNTRKLTSNGIIRQKRARKTLNNLKNEKHIKHSEYTTPNNGR